MYGGDLYLPADGSAGFSGWRRLEDPLLLLWWQRGVERDDFDVANLRAEIVDLTFDPFTSFVDFLDGKKTDVRDHRQRIRCKINMQSTKIHFWQSKFNRINILGTAT